MEKNYQVAVENTLIRNDELYGDDLVYNPEVLKKKLHSVRIKLIKVLGNLSVQEFMDWLDSNTEIGYDDFDNYDEYACKFLQEELEEELEYIIYNTQYSDQLMDEWEKKVEEYESTHELK